MKNPADSAGFLFALFRFIRLIFYAGDFFPFKDFFPRLIVFDTVYVYQLGTLLKLFSENRIAHYHI